MNQEMTTLKGGTGGSGAQAICFLPFPLLPWYPLLEARAWQGVLDQHGGGGGAAPLLRAEAHVLSVQLEPFLSSAHWCTGLRSLAAASLGQWKATVSHGGLSHSPSPKQKHNRLHCHGEFNPLVLGLAQNRILWVLLNYLWRGLNAVHSMLIQTHSLSLD